MNNYHDSTFLFWLFSLIFIFPLSQNRADTMINPGDVHGLWTAAASPYQISGPISIPDDSTLVIEPGVRIEFQGHYPLEIQGRILAIGTALDSIIFTVNDTSGFSNPDLAAGGWNGIRFIDTPADNDSSQLVYCRFEYGKAVGDVWHANAGGALCIVNFDKVLIAYNLFIYNSAGGLETEAPSGGAIHLAFSDAQLIGNTFAYNYAPNGGAVQVHESNALFNNNTIKDNTAQTGGGISIGGTSFPVFSKDKFLNNQADMQGGGLIFGLPSVITCSEITFSGNRAQWGAGIHFSGKLEIKNSNFSANKASQWAGAIGVGGGTLKIDSCTIHDNRAETWGGGIAGDFSTLQVSNCVFHHDSSAWGSGALHADHSQVIVNHSEFKDNRAVFGAGFHAVYSQIQIDNCSFVDNEANSGVGMHIENSDLAVDSCLFEQNHSLETGGALEFRADTVQFETAYQIMISETDFYKNLSQSACAGLKIDQYDSETSLADIKIDHCAFRENQASRISALRILGNFDNILLSNSLFSDNIAISQSADAVLNSCSGRVENCLFSAYSGAPSTSVIQGADIEFFNCTFTRASDDVSSGMTIRSAASVSLTNCILWDCATPVISLTPADTVGSQVTLNYCDIEFGPDSINISDSLSVRIWGTGNISADPLFVDAAHSDFHLRDDSPCIDSGINCLILGEEWRCAPLSDIEGNKRPDPQDSNADMGAYEHGPLNALSEKLPAVPKRFYLGQNYPNPFNPKTIINYELAITNYVELGIFNLIGEKVTTLVSEKQAAGRYRVEWDGSRFASGLYFYRLKTDKGFVETKKLMLLR